MVEREAVGAGVRRVQLARPLRRPDVWVEVNARSHIEARLFSTAPGRRYVAGTIRLKASRPQLAHVARDRLAALQQRHESLRTLLQTNLTVLATAHAVSEGIVRGVSNEIGRRSTPQTYGASGRSNAPKRGAGVPLAISRTL